MKYIQTFFFCSFAFSPHGLTHSFKGPPTIAGKWNDLLDLYRKTEYHMMDMSDTKLEVKLDLFLCGAVYINTGTNLSQSFITYPNS